MIDIVSYELGLSGFERNRLSALMGDANSERGSGPFLTFPKFSTTPTVDEVKEYGVRLGSDIRYSFLSNDDTVYYFRVGKNFVMASKKNTALGYNLSGASVSSLTLRTSRVNILDSTSGLYYSARSNTSVYSSIYNCESISDGLVELASYIL